MSRETTENFIEISGLERTLGGYEVLRGVDLQVRQGETMVIMGRSGEGKSVLLKHVIGLMSPDRGSIRIEGEEIVGKKERDLNSVRRKFGFLFQDGALFDSMNVAENVAFPLRERGVKDRRELLDHARQTLGVVGLEEHLDKMPINLSGGMRKRVALARALITEPRCILYDEPTAGLDPIAADSIDRLIKRLEENFRVTSVVVTHDMKSVSRIASRVAYLREGRIYFLGSVDDLKNSRDPKIRDFIEGRSEDGGGGGEKDAAGNKKPDD